MGQALRLEVPAHLAAIVMYALAVGATLYGAAMDKPGWRAWGYRVAVAAFVVHSVALGARWYGTGHGPYLTRYEVLSANAWMAVAGFLVVRARRRVADALAVVVYPVALLLLGVGMYTGPEVMMLPPTFTGIWLVMHVMFYFVAFSAALVSLGYSLLYVARSHPALARIAARLDVETCDRESYRFAGLTFAFWGIGMLTGSIWAYYSWGRFWGWDPVESWSIVTWFVYGIYLHLRRFYGLKGSRAAIMLLLGFVLAVGSLFFTSLLTTSLHSEYFS